MTALLERTRAPTPSRSRFYTPALASVLVTHMVLWLSVVLQGWLYWDDFILQGQAARLGLSRELLLNNHDGHVMPASYAVVWALQEISGLDYRLVAASMLVGQAVLVWAAVVGFRAILGRTLPAVVATAVFLLSPIMMPGLTWWSASLTLVPLMSCALFATVSHLRYLRTGSPAAAITTFALVAVALGFFEKSILIVLWLFLLTVLVDPSTRVVDALRSALAQHRRLWGGWAAFLAVYLLAFAQVAQGRTHLPTGPGQVVELVRRAVLDTIAPGLVGGPVRWTAVDYSASYADPPAWLVTGAAVAVAALVLAGVRRPGAARKAWIVAGVYLSADLATFAVGRLGPFGDPAVVQAGRYVATAMIPISVAVGATVAAHRGRLSSPRGKWAVAAAVGTTALLTALSTLSYAAIWSKNPAQGWVGNAREDLAVADEAYPLLDQDVPDFLLLPVTHPYNQASWFLAPLTDRPPFGTSTEVLQVLDNGGRLVRARVEGPAAVPPSTGCYAVEPGATTTVPLQSQLIPWLHTVALEYTATTPGLIGVTIGDGEPVPADVRPGAGTVFVRAEGGDARVDINSVDASLCVRSATVGRVVPAELAYGGTLDITDQLEGLAR
jgi:hypothetical protein